MMIMFLLFLILIQEENRILIDVKKIRRILEFDFFSENVFQVTHDL